MNWLISVSRQKHQDKVLAFAEDYAILYKVNERWPGHAVLVPPAPDTQIAHKFGSQLGYNVMYNDVDMVWLDDPFWYLEGNQDVTVEVASYPHLVGLLHH
ncbi:putative nucleotide-diphospho-sugar transferase [Dioscorea sansibarensis]